MHLGCVVVFVVILASFASAQPPSPVQGSNSPATSQDDEALKQLVRDITTAFTKNDRTFIERVLAEDFVGVDLQGRRQSRNALLASLETTPLAGMTALVDAFEVRRRGDVAVVGDILVASFGVAGKKRTFAVRETHTLIREAGQWKLLASHGTEIPEWAARKLNDSELRPLQPQPCGTEPKLKSDITDKQAFVRFRNGSSREVKRYWLDFEGRRNKQVSIIKPGQDDDVWTFLAHPFVIEDADGKCLGIYLPAEAPSLVVVNEPKAKGVDRLARSNPGNVQRR